MVEKQYRILIVDDEDSVRRLLGAVLRREGYQVETAEDGREGLEKFTLWRPDLVLLDIRMPEMDGMTALGEIRRCQPTAKVILMTAFAAVDTAVTALKQGAFDYIIKPFNLDEVKLLASRAKEMSQMTEEISLLHRELNALYRLDHFLTNSPRMKELCRTVAKVAQSNANVLVTGESGTGKELIANTIHYNSLRRQGPFIKVNCGALPEGLLESELFGHERGAFTGAAGRRIGRFEQAAGGTLLLDEIGEMPSSLQVKLLRVLQEKEFQRLGGSQTLKTDVRVIGATNRSLPKLVEEGTFRQDLFYRLNVVTLELLPLRERPEDVALLANHFLQKFSHDNGRDMLGFDRAAMRLLERHDWPGNVRELANVVERAVIMSTGQIIFPEDLPPGLGSQAETHPQPGYRGAGQSLKERVKEAESGFIREALLHNGGNKVQTARELGISRRSLLYKIQEYGLEHCE
ncbi:sigma 54-interacting transcriptional regulator [Azotosporobacter soli]|uniref:sigma 54-interacting transcriptional regulator n=1 Tax=Azotosporobacter soli TaxID=3055040 RepID=UPI0031FE9FF4